MNLSRPEGRAKRFFLAAGLVAAICIGLPPAAHAQRLGTIANEVRNGEPREERPRDDDDDDELWTRKRSHKHRYDDDDEDSLASELMAPIAGACFKGMFVGITSPIWAPVKVCRDEYGPWAKFNHYPYDGFGYVDPFAIDRKEEQRFDRLKSFAGRLAAFHGDQFDGMQQVGGSLQFMTSSRFGFDTQGAWFNERLDDGSHDELGIGDFNIHFRFAQADWGYFYTGLGFNWMSYSDRMRCEDQFNAGFNFTYGFDLFIAEPLISTWQLDVGTLGETHLLRFQTTLGVNYHHVEPYLGYEYLDIGSTQMNQLTAGVRFWF